MYQYPAQNYNNGFQMYPQPQQQTPIDERIWVQNATAAESYLLAPNGFVRLWDSSTNRFYEKRADATGRPFAMDIYEYNKISPQTEKVNESSYDELKAQMQELSERIEALESKKGAGRNAKQSNADDTSV